VEARFSLNGDVIGWRQSKTTGKTHWANVVVRPFARTDHGILAGNEPELDAMNTDNDSLMKKEAGEKTLHRTAKVHMVLELWQGSQNLHATQKESRTQNKQMPAMGYILDTEEIVQASWSLFQHDGVAAFKLSGISHLAPPMSAKKLPGGRTQIFDVRQIERIHCHPVESDDDSAPEIILDTEDWLNWNWVLDNPNDSEDDCAADVESDLGQDKSIEDPECPEQRDVSAPANVPWLIRPTQKSRRQAETVLMTVNAIETRRNQGVKKK